MPTKIFAIENQVRLRLSEPTPRFWSSNELTSIIIAGIKDLWRDIADLKQEHFLTIDSTNVSLAANGTTLTGVPTDIHKIYLIEPRDVSIDGTSRNLIFVPMDYNNDHFRGARAQAAAEPSYGTIYYTITAQGSPVGAPVIYVAPSVTSAVNLTISYVPTLPAMTSNSDVPIPGEADNALVAWTVAYARAKERADLAPDSNWLSIYGTEKAHLLQSLGLRQYQEPSYAQALFESEW